MLSSVATDIFGKSGRAIIEALIEGKDLDEQYLSTLVHGKLRSKIPDLLAALDGSLSQLQKDKIRIILDNFLSLKNVPAKSGNGYLTSMLVQCANAAVKEAGSWLTSRFESIQTRRGRRKAIIATCRSMLTAIYYIISRKEPYREPQKTSYISASKEKKLIAHFSPWATRLKNWLVDM